jgi:hypothetical protein
MSEHVTLVAPAAPPSPPLPALPDWLRRLFLDPNEQIIWWQGPTLRPWREWFQTHQDRMMMASFGVTMLLPLVGLFIGPAGFFFGGCFGVGLLVTVALIGGSGDKYRWQVLTNRRLFVVVGRKKTEEFDLALLRQILSSMGSAGSQPASEQVFDLGKVGASAGAATGPSHGVTDLASVLAMAKLVQQVQGASKIQGPT